MEFLQPTALQEALEAKAAHPEAVPIFGGTDVMVELNFARRRPEAVLDLTRVPEIREWGEDDGRLRVGAGVTYTRIIEEIGDRLPGLAMASRTVGSPQIRNRGTVGGNLGTASPAGDGLPPLYASTPRSRSFSTEGRGPSRSSSWPKRTSLERTSYRRLHVPGPRPQQYSKIGPRNAW
jgi:CO/xanthine dehydrogenase FAD-binding subunit